MAAQEAYNDLMTELFKYDKNPTIPTLSYIEQTSNYIETNYIYRFGEVWNGEGDGKESLYSESISPDNEHIIDFIVMEEDEDDILESKILITNITNIN